MDLRRGKSVQVLLFRDNDNTTGDSQEQSVTSFLTSKE